jgi:hypothetical protein
VVAGILVDPGLGGDEFPVQADIAGFAGFVIVLVVPDNFEWVPIDVEPYKKEKGDGEQQQFEEEEFYIHRWGLELKVYELAVFVDPEKDDQDQHQVIQ